MEPNQPDAPAVDLQAGVQRESQQWHWRKRKSLYVCFLPASIAQGELSLAAKGFFWMLFSLADHKTGVIPFFKSKPDVLERLAQCSKRTRLLLEKELRSARLLSIERELKTGMTRDGRVSGVMQGRNIYTIIQNANVFATAQKRPRR